MQPERDSQNDKLRTDERSEKELDEAQDRLEAIEGIKRGLKSMKRKAGKPAEQFFRELLK